MILVNVWLMMCPLKKIEKFWRLLCDLIAFLSRHNNQEIGIDADEGIDSLEFVQKELVKYGYSNNKFFHGSSALTSSRLLLLTVAWLLSSQDMLELFLLDHQTYDEILEVSLDRKDLLNKSIVLIIALCTQIFSQTGRISALAWTQIEKSKP